MPQELETPEQLYEVTVIAPDGLGYGDGAISVHEREGSSLTHEQLQQAMDVIGTNKDRVIVPVEEDDDGCGDGRPAGMVFQVVNPDGEKKFYRKSKLRAKIFGGGLQVAGSMWRAIAGVPQNNETTLGDREFIADKLRERGIYYGAHIDSHAHGENCGCGAIDKYPVSTQKSAEFQAEITGTIRALAGDELADSPALSRAYDVRAAVARDEHYMSDAAGVKTMNFIERDGGVIKQLEHGHLEAITVINTEPGATVDQKTAAELFEQAGLPVDIQIFVIDAWRGEMYADAVADVAVQTLGADRAAARQIALADFYVNQLSVAATLTDGSQPTMLNQAA